MRRAVALLACLALPAQAGEDGRGAPETVAAAEAAPFPVEVGGAFTLTDQHGAARGAADPRGRLQLLFFGYANCRSICSVAMPAMAEAVDRLSERGIAAVPVMVTVDPERDRAGTMAAPLARLHPDFVGLTGSEADLEEVYRLFSVERTVLFEDPEGGPVYAHGSFVYVLDGAGRVRTLLPPILSPARLADIAAAHAGS